MNWIVSVQRRNRRILRLPRFCGNGVWRKQKGNWKHNWNTKFGCSAGSEGMFLFSAGEVLPVKVFCFISRFLQKGISTGWRGLSRRVSPPKNTGGQRNCFLPLFKRLSMPPALVWSANGWSRPPGSLSGKWGFPGCPLFFGDMEWGRRIRIPTFFAGERGKAGIRHGAFPLSSDILAQLAGYCNRGYHFGNGYRRETVFPSLGGGWATSAVTV